MLEISERLIAYGNSEFIREVLIPSATGLAWAFEDYPRTSDQEVELYDTTTAFASEIDAIIGVAAFIGVWSATKILDELYDAKISPSIKKYLGSYIDSRPTRKKYSLSISLNRNGRKNSVFICCVGSSLMEIEESERKIDGIIKLSEAFLDQDDNGSVFMFVVDNGVCDQIPSKYRNYNEAINGLKTLYPIKPPKYIR